MLRYLRIRDLALLADVEIRFGPGLNLLTGETGAGKSIVVDALGLILGDRASSDLVRTGASRAVVEGVFTLTPEDPAWAVLRECGIDADPADGELLVRREVSADGSRGFLNGSPATVGMIRRVCGGLVDIHGQHEHLSLLDPRAQLEALDGYAGLGALRQDVAGAHASLAAALERQAAAGRDRVAIEERLEILRYRVREIDRVQPEEGEDEKLHRERERLAHAARIEELGSRSYRLLDGEDQPSLLEGLRNLEGMLRELGGYLPELAAPADEVAASRLSLEEIALQLRDPPEEGAECPGRLERIEERLSALADLSRRFGGSLAAAIDARDAAAAELAEIESGLGDPASLAAAVAEAATVFGDLAGQLTARRRRAAGRLRRALERELAELAMGSTGVEIRIQRREDPGSPVRLDGKPVAFDARGADQVELWFSANPGEEPRPVARAASGGELSRFMLALECARLEGKGRAARRLVFDEIDAGIGGRVAGAVGERLHRISRERQVLCVTHLAQIASRADQHLVVEKEVVDGRTRTRVRALDRRGRVAEVARMLGGARITEVSRRHARELIGSAGAAPEGT
ncbi:MAG: DNA repair protein RecN [Acidobacteriota bacterium]|jgi:DNA repair protein RecN (Recombination protein N)